MVLFCHKIFGNTWPQGPVTLWVGAAQGKLTTSQEALWYWIYNGFSCHVIFQDHKIQNISYKSWGKINRI